MSFKPNLAGKFDPATQKFPTIGSPKIDGFRCTVLNGVGMARSMKPIPNKFVQALIAVNAREVENLDGELLVGEPNDPKVFEKTSGPIRREEGRPNFSFWVFDVVDLGASISYQDRLDFIAGSELPGWVKLVPTRTLHNMDELNAYEAEMLDAGFEGIMLRDPSSLYKQGRSTAKEGGLVKVKRNEEAEARIVGFEEEMHNGNVAQTNELGRTKRSTHAENLVGKGTLGALVVEGVNGTFKGVRFNIGTGFTAEMRRDMWLRRDELLGRVVSYKFFPIGCKDAPRHPVYLRERPEFDLELAA